MSRFLLDTNIISEAMREKPNLHFARWYENQNMDTLFLSSITLAELWQGVHQLDEKHPKRSLYKKSIAFIEDQYSGRILPFDRTAAALWGALRGRQKRLGRLLPELAMQIAAIALQNKLIVVTANTRHFEGLGFPVLNPKEAPSAL